MTWRLTAWLCCSTGARGWQFLWCPPALILIGCAAGCDSASAADTSGAARFRKEIQPILSEYCYDCHGDGMDKGNISFDTFKSDEELLSKRDLWWAVLKNTRAGVMPPENKEQPGAGEKERLAQWIKDEVFGIDPRNPDPGRVTARRLNRVEYRNTVRDLLDVEFDTEAEFPPDDTGYGFDNNGDVLTLPPMLLEKYLEAARTIVSKAVPTTPRVMPERRISGRKFSGAESNAYRGALVLSYYEPATVSNRFQIEHAGRYQLALDFSANEKYVDNQFDYNKCRVIFRVDGQRLLQEDYGRQENKPFHFQFTRDWQAGPHEITLELQPLTPDEKHVRSLAIRLDAVTVRGPDKQKYWVAPAKYRRFFPRDVPSGAAARLDYARELLRDFAAKAFRRPVDSKTVDRLADLAQKTYHQPRQTFEAGVAHAMVAVLASPRFLFREESSEPDPQSPYPFVDEYALASRLSYFLWSSMPDDELFRLAGGRELKGNLAAQVRRMLADPKSEALMRNFTGQWLQARDVETVVLDARGILTREQKPDPERDRLRDRFNQLRNKPDGILTADEKAELEQVRAELFKRFPPLRADMSGEMRQAMQRETEKYFEYVVRQDRALVEFIDSNYAFLNEKLAKHYGINDVTGDDIRLVLLPADSARGGILTQGTVLSVTSNPTRTSPVKRGLFVLDNILGMPPPPPPPNIPPLEDAAKEVKGHEPSLRETLAMHRAKPLCSSCHNRMDPLGLAMENFNAMGMWRDREFDQPIDVTGQLITGESFTNIVELKHILATNHRTDFHRCLTEKLLTYALGRGLDYYDAQTVDDIVSKIEKEDGRFSALLMGVIESTPFQKRRDPAMLAAVNQSNARDAGLKQR